MRIFFFFSQELMTKSNAHRNIRSLILLIDFSFPSSVPIWCYFIFRKCWTFYSFVYILFSKHKNLTNIRQSHTKSLKKKKKKENEKYVSTINARTHFTLSRAQHTNRMSKQAKTPAWVKFMQIDFTHNWHSTQSSTGSEWDLYACKREVQ